MTTTTTAQTIPPTTATPETAQATFISIVADASGSMSHLHETVIKGLNDFIAEQATTDNDAKVTIVQFPSVKDEDGIQTILPKSNVKTARKITGDDYVINGMTPLYDAIGAVIKKADQRIAKRVAKGKDLESQVVVIFTDGGENASRKFTKDAIFSLGLRLPRRQSRCLRRRWPSRFCRWQHHELCRLRRRYDQCAVERVPLGSCLLGHADGRALHGERCDLLD